MSSGQGINNDSLTSSNTTDSRDNSASTSVPTNDTNRTDTIPDNITSVLSSTLSSGDLPLTYTPQDLAGLGLTSPYPFNSTGDGPWTPTYDPILSGFNYTGTNLIAAPQLQNQFFFPGTADLAVWGQDPLLLNNNWLLSPVALDQAQLPIDGPVDTIPLGQSFAGMSLNGSMVQPPIMQPNVSPENIVPIAVVPTPPVVPIQPEKPKSWAAIASQPAKPKPSPPLKSHTSPSDVPIRGNSGSNTSLNASQTGRGPKKTLAKSNHTSGSNSKLDVVTQLKAENNYNPPELNLNLNNARYFVIKSYAEDDVHRSIKYNVWCSTEHGNRRLDNAFKDQKSKGGAVYLLFSVNGSGHFCGVAQMLSEVELSTDTGIWTQDKWKGRFDLKWIYVKDVPNNQLRHIRLENNENKPVTNSRDTQEVPPEKGKMVVKIIHQFLHTTSIFDDFEHYEKRQEEDGGLSPPQDNPGNLTTSSSGGSTTSKKESKRS